MPESPAQTGIAAFIPIDQANAMAALSQETFTLLHRPNDPSVTFVVKRVDIERIVPGGDVDGHRLMQVLLKPGSVVETKIEALRGVKNLQDPTLLHLTAPAISTHSSLPASS